MIFHRSYTTEAGEVLKKKSALAWIWKNAKGQGVRLAVLSLFSMITSSLYVVPALLSRRAINVAAEAESLAAAKPLLYSCALGLLLTIFVQLALTAACTHLKAVISGKMEMALRQSFFASILRKEYPAISRFHSGELLNRFTSDIDVVVSGFTGFLPAALAILAKLLSGLVLLISFSPSYALLSVLVGLFILAFAALLRPVYKKIHASVQTASGLSRSFAQECTENMVAVKSFSANRQILHTLLLRLARVYKVKIRRSLVSNFTHSGISLIFTLAYYSTLLWGAFSIVGGEMDYGTLLAFLQVVSQIQTPFLNASGLLTQMYAALASAERLMEIEMLADEPVAAGFSASTLYEQMDALCAENLSFRYDKDLVIRSADFTLPRGSLTAITGISGTGKSTLFRLLLGLFPPTSGSLFVQTKDGPTRLGAETRALFAYVPQGHLLFSGTIRENIKFTDPSITDAQMEKAAKAACIYDFIMGLPKGFDTPLGEHGGGISEGQMQRIAIARALCSDAPILLLDECTSALDSETEEALLQNLAALKTKTILFISHKNAAFSFCDHQLTAEDGVFRLITL